MLQRGSKDGRIIAGASAWASSRPSGLTHIISCRQCRVRRRSAGRRLAWIPDNNIWSSGFGVGVYPFSTNGRNNDLEPNKPRRPEVAIMNDEEGEDIYKVSPRAFHPNTHTPVERAHSAC